MRSKRGHPAKENFERLQTKLWFFAVSDTSGMNANQLRQFFVERIGDGNDGDKEPSHSWYRYARGDQLPAGAAVGRSSLVRAVEEVFPGTAHWIRSPLWVMFRKQLTIEDAVILLKETEKDIGDLFDYGNNKINISIPSWNYLRGIMSFNVFGSMVLFNRIRGYEEHMTPLRIQHCRRWLHDGYHYFPSIRKNRDELVAVLGQQLPELGDLSYLGNEAPDKDSFSELLMRHFSL
ncbi:hypothetical protein [uncultured Propionivibrio sp.]|uniref:hypothetical protein n=1 Tax=uncultured Propionivibrio sp. TaxID=426737 RepID=UPI0029C0C642|nr:hypothetical protein [uncultured Propionivibrio sp.]